ncbi:DarT ssDNA thymidine ADP-ribosyltransferase family protein [Clostridium perfringens]|uniref:DarT ssDNA thymidine ADP-ribosyltransferase family protein n=1 Tax=Clostridium perfringens TaxID=1502 RepID=UPI002A1B1D6B|nr:DarT ssDNA thymidine ADP-ribosyltransferase family protein [Clostridium perfringens]
MCKIDMKLIKERGITRLCHFTKSKNLTHILGEFGGIKSSDKIPNHYKDVNDLLRLDGKVSHICCSVEYPNLYYFGSIKDNDKLFKDWIILLINPKVMSEVDCLFSPVNAATEKGKYIKEGVEGFNKMYENTISTNRRRIRRSLNIPKECPTDFQAEVLVKEYIGNEYIEGIIVQNEEQARHEKFKLSILGLDKKIKVYVSEDAFSKSIYDGIKNGIKPKERIV